MAKSWFGFRSAQEQLVWIVFMPIMLLAMAGAVLMVIEVRHAVLSEQNAIARASLLRYEALLRPALSDWVAGKSSNLTLPTPPHDALDDMPIFSILGKPQNPKDWLRRVVVMDESLTTLIDTGLPMSEKLNPKGDFWQQDTTLGKAYGIPMAVEGRTFWLVVELDNQPVCTTYYRTILVLLVAGSLTLILLLVILGGYARRWITPVYELRMYLQHLTVDTLIAPPKTNTGGEFTLLYRDLVQATRRLYQGFDELKTQVHETEKALDDMEARVVMAEAHSRDMISLNQSKSAFLANISHELRTPLNSIDGFINLLSRQQGLTNEQTLYIQTIKKSSAHLLALVNDVLDFSKIEAGKLILEHHEFDLYAIIYEVVDMLSPSALEKNLRLCVMVYNDVPSRVMGDSLRVKQVLTNLVGNAIKFTDTGGVVVKVGLADKDGFLHISVVDTGKGVSDSDKEHLFKSFSQGDLSITRRYGGTGLGLVISKQLIHQMGGAIGFWDNASHDLAKTGATFWFEIPTGQTDNTPEISPPVLERLPLNLLVWINHNPTLKMLKASLAGTQAKIHFAIGFADLLEQLDKPNHEFNWVIVDYFGQDASLDDVGAILRQIRSRYQGRLATYGYQVGMDAQMLAEYDTDALYEPMDKRQLYALLNNQHTTTPKNTKPFAGRRVLIVDDYAPNLLVAEAFLVELGAEVVQANSGFEAIETMTKAVMGELLPIDLVLMDIQMPRMSGLEATLQIRKIQADHHKNPTPIIALTAHGLSDEKNRLVKAGMNDYASKPVSLEKLAQILEKWLEPAKSGETQTEPAHTPKDPTTPDDSPKHLDWTDALERAGSRTELAKTLLQMVIDSASQEKHTLEQAWANRDRSGLANIAHRLVGASRYTGVPYLRQTAEAFEGKCRADLDNVADTEFIQMRPAYRELIDALDTLGSVVLDEWLVHQS